MRLQYSTNKSFFIIIIIALFIYTLFLSLENGKKTILLPALHTKTLINLIYKTKFIGDRSNYRGIIKLSFFLHFNRIQIIIMHFIAFHDY